MWVVCTILTNASHTRESIARGVHCLPHDGPAYAARRLRGHITFQVLRIACVRDPQHRMSTNSVL
jgi:hypothetical protein